MACRIILSPITNKEETSILWNEIRSIVPTDEQADAAYGNTTTEEFVEVFGNWVEEPESIDKNKVNSIGEPILTEEVKSFIGLNSSITKEAINYYDEPEFKKRNPDFNPEAYVNTVNKFGETKQEFPELTPTLRREEEVAYYLKSVAILFSKEAEQMFIKGKKHNWDLNKILTELKIPKEQKQIILDSGKTDREEIITDLLTNYSYTIEINTAKEKNNLFNVEFEFKDEFIKLLNDYNPNYKTKGNVVDVKLPTNKGNGVYGYIIVYDSGGFYDTDTKLDKRYNQFFKEFDKPTQHYSNLTVPGGTNYIENEIATPAITPSIKGHAQFATPNGIGWFRSDEKNNTKFIDTELGKAETIDYQSTIDYLKKIGDLKIEC